MNPVTPLLKGAVIAYQWTLRPILGCNCRFHPSCSNYALEALSEHGAWRASGLAAWRILRCNPWNPGGYDPVPRRFPGPIHAMAASGQGRPDLSPGDAPARAAAPTPET